MVSKVLIPRMFRRMRRVLRGRGAFLAGALLVWALSVLNSLHMLVHSTKRECILYYIC